MSAGRALLGVRDFRLLWIGETTSTLGSSVTSIAVPLVAVQTLRASVFLVSLLTAAAWLPWLVIGLPAGAWVDRLPRRKVMLASDMIALLAFGSVPVLAWCGALDYGQLLGVAVLAGAAAVFFQTAYNVFVPALLSDELLTRGNALLQGSQSAVQVAGPGLAGLIADLAGAVCGLVVDAASFAVSAFCLIRIGPGEADRSGSGAGGGPAGRGGLWGDVGTGIGYVLRDPFLRVLTVFGAASNVALTGYQAIMIVFLARVVGLRAGEIGLVMALGSAGGVLGAALAPRVARWLGSGRALLVCELATAPFALLIPLTARGPRLGCAVAGGLVLVAGLVAGNVIKGGWRQQYCPREMLGRITVSMQLLNYGAIPLGALTGGSLAAALGVRTALWIMTSGVTAAAFVLLVGPIPAHRDLPAAPPERASMRPKSPQPCPARGIVR
jgi:predicted MFS family arabinose efflux permease